MSPDPPPHMAMGVGSGNDTKTAMHMLDNTWVKPEETPAAQYPVQL